MVLPKIPTRWRRTSKEATAADEALIDEIARGLSLSRVTARILIQRGITSLEEAKTYLHSDLSQLPDPFTLKDMDRAVSLIVEAIQNKKKIAVWGDYDVDGTTGAALLYTFFKELSVDVIVHQPDRFKEGYGINPEWIEKLKDEKGVDLVVSVDCGITSFEAAKKAKEIGLTLVVTDHHRPKAEAPEADCIVNPNLESDTSDLKMLAGVGVGFYLAIALRKGLRDVSYFSNREEPNLKSYLDLVALGTVADLAPMIGVNRILVREGMKVLERSGRPGIQALLKASNCPLPITAYQIGFVLGPRINAAGRVGTPKIAFDLLTATSREKAEELAVTLEGLNLERRGLQKEIWEEACQMVDSLSDPTKRRSLVLFSENWHEGVIGIVAGKVTEKYQKPTVVIHFPKDPETGLPSSVGKGSVRSYGNINILEALNFSGQALEEFGGHAQAAGLTIKKDQINHFWELLETYLKANTDESDYLPCLQVDCEVDLQDMSQQVVKEIQSIGPFGVKNPEPVFYSNAVSERILLLKGKHLKLKLTSPTQSRKRSIDAIGFNMAERERLPEEGKPLQIAYTPDINTWGGVSSLQLKLKDLEAH